jgi:hypothetical protein
LLAHFETDNTMRIYIFKSDARPDLRAFSDDRSGVKLPASFRPWHAFGAVAAGNDSPHGLDRDEIERAIRDTGFQLWRMKRQTEKLNREYPFQLGSHDAPRHEDEKSAG